MFLRMHAMRENKKTDRINAHAKQSNWTIKWFEAQNTNLRPRLESFAQGLLGLAVLSLRSEPEEEFM